MAWGQRLFAIERTSGVTSAVVYCTSFERVCEPDSDV